MLRPLLMLSPRVALCTSWLASAALLAQDWRVVDGPQRVTTGTYDAARGRVVTVASGRETREWDGTHWLQRPIPLLSTLPMCMAYDEARRVTVACILDLTFTPPLAIRTWESNGSAWTLRATTTAPPFQPSGHCVYDSARRRVVYVTSNAPGGTFSTLEWDGQNWLTRPTPTALTGRLQVALAYDAARARTVLFGGLGSGGAFGVPLADTWEWDGTAWLRRTFAVQPGARAGAALAYDSGRQVCVLFGGPQADTWEYDGVAWTPRTGPMPPARTSPGLVYDAQRGRTVLFGGRGVPFWLHDVWEWDGTFWTPRLADVEPPFRSYPALTYSATRDRLVMFGGDLGTGVANETWEWGAGGWSRLAPPQSPPGRHSHSMWSDGTDVFVFGGNHPGSTSSQGDTWRFDGSTWQQVVGSGPSARAGAAVTFDPTTGGALLFGGSTGINPGTFFGDTWRLTATGWSQVTVSPAPSPRTAAAIATDPVRGRIVLWGGVGPNGSFDDTWEWDGVAWLPQNPLHRPPAVGNNQSMAFEPKSGVVVLLTRPTLTAPDMETWVWTGSDWLRLATPTRVAAVPGIRVVGTSGRVFAHDGEHLHAITAQAPLVGSYGAGCPTAPPTPAPRLEADTWPRPGASDFALRSSGHAPNAAAVFVVGTAAGTTPIGSCTLLVQQGGPLVGAVVDPLGLCSLPVPLAPVSALVGLRAFAQVWSFGANGLAATNGVDVTIGD